MLYTIASKRIKCLEVNFTKEMQNCTHKTLSKEIKQYLNKWTYIACPWIRRLNIVDMATFPILMHGISANPVKITMSFFPLSFFFFTWKASHQIHLVATKPTLEYPYRRVLFSSKNRHYNLTNIKILC